MKKKKKPNCTFDRFSSAFETAPNGKRSDLFLLKSAFKTTAIMHQLIFTLCIWYIFCVRAYKIACLTVLRSSSVGTEIFFLLMFLFCLLLFAKHHHFPWFLIWKKKYQKIERKKLMDAVVGRNKNYFFIKYINFHQIFIKSREKIAFSSRSSAFHLNISREVYTIFQQPTNDRFNVNE